MTYANILFSGTPNSTTTSVSTLSALSTTAIKDGHRGSQAHPTAYPYALSASHAAHASHHRHHPSSTTLEAERADRISRLAGLERVSTVRAPNTSNPAPSPGFSSSQLGGGAGSAVAYFDAHGTPVVNTRMSTVGTASATSGPGSAGARTTWEGGSVRGLGTEYGEGDDGMSVDTNYRDMGRDEDRYSVSASAMGGDEADGDGDGDNDGDGMSDRASLVGFGEGAGSTVSGPIYRTGDSRTNLHSPVVSGVRLGMLGREGGSISAQGSATGPLSSSSMPYETSRSPIVPPPILGSAGGVETAERIVGERMESVDARKPPLGPPEGSDALGKFYFEDKK